MQVPRYLLFALLQVLLVNETLAQPSISSRSFSILQNPYSEREEKKPIRFDYGMNMGFYLAHPGTANYYNGSGGHSLERAIVSNNYVYNRIRQDIGYDFEIHGLPGKMSYKPAIMLGFFGALHFNAYAAIMAGFNYARLKAEDQFTLEIERVVFIEGDNIELYPIYGAEERLDLQLSFQYTLISKNSYLHPFIETGISITDTKVKENRVRIRSNVYSILNPESQFFLIRDYGIGFGGFATAGLKVDVNESVAIWLGYSANYSRINLGNNQKFLLQHSVFLRFSLANLNTRN